jgi:hypothetical protein
VAVVAVVVVVVVAGLTSSCGLPQRQAAPLCRLPAVGADTLVLLAQAVPTADRVPCVANYPAGWHFADLDIHSGEGWFSLDNDRAGVSAVRVTLTSSCDTDAFTEIASDEIDTIRFERVLSVEGRFRAVRAYRFAGGCVTYRFQFSQRGQALVNEVSSMVTFVTRKEIDAAVRATHDGSISLDTRTLGER